jgi:hypothetical protein
MCHVSNKRQNDEWYAELLIYHHHKPEDLTKYEVKEAPFSQQAATIFGRCYTSTSKILV